MHFNNKVEQSVPSKFDIIITLLPSYELRFVKIKRVVR